MRYTISVDIGLFSFSTFDLTSAPHASAGPRAYSLRIAMHLESVWCPMSAFEARMVLCNLNGLFVG